MLREIPGALASELRLLDWRGPRGLEAAEAAASVTLAVLAALALHADAPWWAGLSAFMVSKAAPLAAVSRGIMRVIGSIVGALAALVLLRLFVYQWLPFCLSLFALSCIGSFGFVSSRFGYAWLVGTVTACLVMLMSFDQPHGAFNTAVNRVAEVTIGMLVHACRGGLTVMLMPALANWLAPVSPVTMGHTAVMVMSIPPTAILAPDSPAIVQRSAHRLFGCLLGALAGLACLAFVGSDFLLWLVLIPPGIWLCSQIQTGSAGVSYIGTQAMFAYLMSMVQGQGPPDTISPGLERLVGVMAGLAILFVVTLVLSLIPMSKLATSPAVGD